jgi:hypothetical protein
MNATTTAQQTIDQTVKGLIIGVLSWLAMKYDVPAEISVPGVALVAALLAWVSAKVGADKSTASFVGPKAE